MPPSSSRARRGMRALAATSGLALVATSTALISSPAQAADPVEIQIVGTNDFHGRLSSGFDIPGAAKYAGAVEEFRAENPNTIFAAAGDLIGATTFDSFIAQDKPTIDVFNQMDLDVSAVGNHELDQGYADLVDRVMAPFDEEANPYGGAEWEYIAANIDEPGDADEIAPSWTTEVDGVTVGFVGAVTEHLDELVSPDGIEGLETTDIVEATNEEAAELKTAGADVVVLLVHEGAPSTQCETMATDPDSDFAAIVNDVSGDVDAIVSGHTHLNYSCEFPVADWAGRDVTDRPVVSAGQYGAYLNRLSFTVDPDTGSVLAVENQNVNINTGAFTPDAAVQAIVDQAAADAEGPGSVELGEIEGAFKRANRPKADETGFEENRGAESTLGNLVAEVQRWAADSDIGFMNPGGLRADMVGNAEGGYPAPLTYRQAANVQPFANTLVNIELTGEQIEDVLEEQWQPEGASRPFLRLGTSEGFDYTYDPAAQEITGMWLDGEPLDESMTYTVTANSFIAAGGDNFPTFTEGPQTDSGQADLQAMVDYMDEFASSEPLGVDYSQRAVGVSFPDDAPAKYGAGDTLEFDLSSLAMTGVGDLHDDEVVVSLGDDELGTFPVDNSVAPGVTTDESGTAAVSVMLPSSLAVGAHTITVTGAQTGTEVAVPFAVAKADSKVTAKATPKKVVAKKTKAKVKVTVKSEGEKASGKVQVKAGGKTYQAKLTNGTAKVTLKKFGKPGKKTVKVKYLGNDSTKTSSTTLTIKVVKKKK
ncbi:MAG: bifunctional UDP-sugar hydrolase/5'-nucleotidase [Nocardioides sp.]